MQLVRALILFAVATVSYAGLIAPVAYTAPKAVINTEYDPHPQYSYAYDVQDSITGDSKNHHETRNGDLVQGSYSLIDSDGTRRTVDYVADPVHGFNAVVRKEPLVHSGPVPLVAKVASPVVAKVSAPLVAKVAAAPVVAKVPAAIALSAPIAYSAPARAPVVKTVATAPVPVSLQYAAAPIAYAAYNAPVAAYGAHPPYVARYAATPLAYSAPLVYSAPVVAKVSAPLVTKVTHF